MNAICKKYIWSTPDIFFSKAIKKIWSTPDIFSLQTSLNNLEYFRYVFLNRLALGLSMNHQVDLKGDPQGHP